MQVIPLQPVPAQTFNVTLGEQLCSITLYQRAYGMFLDLKVDDKQILTGALCMNLVKIVRSEYLGFIGDLCFNDTQGNEDPFYGLLGSRFVLLWLEPND
jgi:hypothetical protein